MNDKNEAGKELLLLLLGMLMCGVGLYLFFTSVHVYTSFGSMFGSWGLFGGRGVSGGLVLIPLIIGIMAWIIFPDNFAGKFICILGTLFIILGIISSMNFVWSGGSLYSVIIILILIFGGAALALRVIFMPSINKKQKSKEKIDEISKKLEL
ncbi:MAG: hypothetical protein IIT48_00455 [Lachnospiraceae bacterium]|nr:hypothetical protein [Lachnospiraceae bacterium]